MVKTRHAIAVNYSLTGIIAVADTVKDHAKDAIKQLHDMGIEVAMLTGDNKTLSSHCKTSRHRYCYCRYFTRRKSCTNCETTATR
ncbi:HAD family hydrolase [Staphylococcus aureus]